ncbi:hypothetical protein JD844_013423 [Phrynosoma platyrhinos]|uniref:valine--tRNA ligase n=1 Tax=Phrynosoma platyrhinos TaxID=52577 RepID=A0ABQ7TMM4_PHRPL|nr:hypothetical protein JD844_013423 [Phrynosoma platyrhinos]
MNLQGLFLRSIALSPLIVEVSEVNAGNLTAVVERKIWKEQRVRRRELTREKKGNEIFQQLKVMGASLDWDRVCFTMDSVENRQLVGRTELSVPGIPDKVPFGVLEMFAYKHLHGKRLCHPFTGCLIPVITDPLVDQEMGTGEKKMHESIIAISFHLAGAVKVTPAHSYADYELACEHSLPFISVIAEDGTMTTECGEWLQGLNRFVAREKVLAALKEKGLHRGAKENPLVLPLCSRSGDVIEILLKNQWFVRCETMAHKALEAVESGCLKLAPKFYEKNWRTWLLSTSDWCISRQLWWGHQIPAYRVTVSGSPDLGKQEESDGFWVIGRTETEARKKAASMLGKSEEDLELVRDADVLDTWFSSGLFPFAALGWPHNVSKPGGGDRIANPLLFLARCRSFQTERQRKILQKKLQNSNLDPREVAIAMEGQRRDFPEGIPECGTDALRFALCSYCAQGNGINLDVATVENASRFCNKVWNALKFTLAALGEGFNPLAPEEVTGNESIKPILKSGDPSQLLATHQTLHSCVDLALRLLSPFMPFLTEELWQRLPKRDSKSPPSICVARYPSKEHLAHWCHPEEEANFLLVQEVIRVVRSLRATYQLTKARPTVYLICPEAVPLGAYENYREALQTLSLAGSLRLLPDSEGAEPPASCVVGRANSHTDIYVDLQGLVDPQKELLKLTSRQQKLDQQLADVTVRVERTRDQEQISLLRSELEKVKQAITTFQKMARKQKLSPERSE